jgi:hypothetical protein
LRFQIAAWALLACASATAAETPAPSVKAGPYTVTVERVARVLDLGQAPQPRASLVVTVSVRAQEAAELDKLVELAREADARDELLGALKVREIRPLASPEAGRRRAEIVFSPPSPMANSLRSLSASLVSSKSMETLRLEAPAAPAGSARDPAGSLSVTVESVAPGKDARGKPVEVVRFTIGVAAAAADLPLLNESIVLTDNQGMAYAALSETRSFEYAAEDQRLTAIKVTAHFAALGTTRRPKTLRYALKRGVGIEVLPYQFRNLPLP